MDAKFYMLNQKFYRKKCYFNKIKINEELSKNVSTKILRENLVK